MSTCATFLRPDPAGGLGDINIDALPDGDPSEDGDEKNIPAELIQMKQYYENSKIIKKYMEEIASGNTSPPGSKRLVPDDGEAYPR